MIELTFITILFSSCTDQNIYIHVHSLVPIKVFRPVNDQRKDVVDVYTQ